MPRRAWTFPPLGYRRLHPAESTTALHLAPFVTAFHSTFGLGLISFPRFRVFIGSLAPFPGISCLAKPQLVPVLRVAPDKLPRHVGPVIVVDLHYFVAPPPFNTHLPADALAHQADAETGKPVRRRHKRPLH